MALTKQTISTDELSTFGARLRSERDKQGLSRPALSKLTDGTLSARVIDHLENGTTDATGPRVEVLSKALDVNRNWLMFGEPVSGNQENDNPVSAPDDHPVYPGDVPEKALMTLESAPESPKKALGALGVPDASRQYFDAMRQALSHIEQLREDGLEKHPRKLPKLLDKAVEIGQCLEQSDLKKLAEIRSVDIAGFSDDSLQEELFAEITLRLIDTALLGMDLYVLDMDTLEAYAEKADVSSPFLGWKNHEKIVRNVRGAYWKEALKGGLYLTTALRHSG